MNDDDTQPSEMPAQPKTKEIPAARPEDILLAEVRNGFRAINQRLDSLEGSDRSIADEVQRLGREIVDLRADGRRHDEDIRRLSDRTKETNAQTSSADLGQAAALAEEKVAREALAKEVRDIASTLKEQNDFMGLGKKGVEWLRSKEARADIMRVATLIGVAYAALKAAGLIK